MGAVKLGSVVRDTITGQTGVAMARVKWLFGCERIGLAAMSLNKDGKADDVAWFDDQRIENVPGETDRLAAVPAKALGFKLGSKVRDRITGFTGLAVASAEWVSGYTTVNIESDQLKDGVPIGQHTFEMDRVELVEPGVPKVAPQSQAISGGPQNDPKGLI